MNKLILLVKNLFDFIFSFFKKSPKIWLFRNLGLTLPLPPPRPQNEPLFTKEEEERVQRAPREMVRCYRHHSELLEFLAGGIIDKKLPVGSILYIPRQAYVDHHLGLKPDANPASYLNGPIKRELHDHQWFTKKGIEFKQELVYATGEKLNEEESYEHGEALFEIKRTR